MHSTASNGIRRWLIGLIITLLIQTLAVVGSVSWWASGIASRLSALENITLQYHERITYLERRTD